MRKYFPILIVVAIVCIFISIEQITEIDAYSGKVRKRTLSCKITAYSKVTNTRLFYNLPETQVRKNPLWKKDSKFSMLNQHISPHYIHHGIIYKIDIIMDLLEKYSVEQEKKTKLSSYILRLIQNDKELWLLPFIDKEANNSKQNIESFIDQLDNNKLLREDYADQFHEDGRSK